MQVAIKSTHNLGTEKTRKTRKFCQDPSRNRKWPRNRPRGIPTPRQSSSSAATDDAANRSRPELRERTELSSFRQRKNLNMCVHRVAKTKRRNWKPRLLFQSGSKNSRGNEHIEAWACSSCDITPWWEMYYAYILEDVEKLNCSCFLKLWKDFRKLLSYFDCNSYACSN